MSLIIPMSVRENAFTGLSLKDAGFTGGTPATIEIGLQLSTDIRVSPSTLDYLKIWFQRHKYLCFCNYRKWAEHDFPADDAAMAHYHGVVDWLLMGGTEGFEWVQSLASASSQRMS